MRPKLFLFSIFLVGNSVSTLAEESKRWSKDDILFELGTRVWIGETAYDNQLYSFEPNTLDSRLRWQDVAGASSELTFLVEQKSTGLFLKGYGGLGANYGGSLDDEDYAYNVDTPLGPFTGKFFDTFLKGDTASNFYGALDIGAELPLPKSSPLQLSAFIGGFVQSHSMLSRGIRCNADEAQNLLCGEPGTVLAPFNMKSIGFESQIMGARLGVGGELDLTERLSWSNEFAYVFGGQFDLNDSHYLRTSVEAENPDNNLGPAPNIVSRSNKLRGIQLESHMKWAVNENWSLDLGARYWRFNSGKSDTVFGAQLPVADQTGDDQYTKNKIEQYGVMLGATYRF
jgi:hypothetical protein